MRRATAGLGGLLALAGLALGGCTTIIYVDRHDGGAAAQSDGGGGKGLCAPCETHDDCGGPDDYCLRNNNTDEVFCAVTCQGGACPDGFTCVHISGSGIEADQCVPTTGSCADTPVPTGCAPACGANETCQDGSCVPTGGCNPACGANETCQNGTCVPAGGCNPACQSGQTCQNGTCVPTGGCNPACQGGQVCQNGTCVTPAPYEAELQHCVDVINQYRATNGRPPYTRSAAIEAYAAEGAQYDSQHGSAHGHFMATQGGGVAWAENEIPGWDMSFGNGSVMGVIDEGLQMMWDEGPAAATTTT
ncbi:MAG: hypothetical protein HY906_11250 [Deltaproteobacteria bacterium]|nr:hypothetical protein [Deltaproteobacteria bacterium]